MTASFTDVLSRAPRSMSDDLPELDPHDFRQYRRWFGLMVRCKANGVGREEWIAWCQRDEKYATEKNAKWIGNAWDSCGETNLWTVGG